MKTASKITLLLTLGLSLLATPSFADTFEYSYQFGDGLLVSGSFSGIRNGQFVDAVSDVSVVFNSVAMTGPVYTSQFDGAGYFAGPIVSFDALQNNFFFSNSDFANGDFLADSFFYITNSSVFSDTAYAQSYPLAYSGSTDFPTQRTSWTLTQVPDSGATILMLGFAVLGFAVVRRRR